MSTNPSQMKRFIVLQILTADYSPCTPLARTIKYKETRLLFNKLTNTIYISYTAMLLILIRDLAAEFP